MRQFAFRTPSGEILTSVDLVEVEIEDSFDSSPEVLLNRGTVKANQTAKKFHISLTKEQPKDV